MQKFLPLAAFTGLSLLLLPPQASAQNTTPYWSLNGNNNATLSHKIGTTNAVSLRFVTSNKERMKIHANGNIGIGTTSPEARLHVAGNGLFTNQIKAVGMYSEIPDDSLQGYPLEPGISSKGLDGVRGLGHHQYGSGLYGQGNFGLYASGSNYGVYGMGEATGVYGTAGDNGSTGVLGEVKYGSGVEGRGETGLSGYGSTYGVYAGGGVVAGQFDGDVVVSGSFSTGDKNLQTDITTFSDAMSLINKLSPKYFAFKQDARFASLNLPKGKHYGLIAQEVEAALPGFVKETPHRLYSTKMTPAPVRGQDGKITYQDRPQPVVTETVSLKAVNYTELIPVIIKAMQEQYANAAAEKADLEAQVAGLEARIQKLEAQLNQQSNSVGSAPGYMEQNTPNPARSSTLIRYQVPSTAASAYITLTDQSGQVVKTIGVNKGNGQIDVNSAALAKGTYHYTLWIDGVKAETKRLIVVR